VYVCVCVCVCVRMCVCVCSLLLPTWPAGPVNGSLSLAEHWVLAEHNTEQWGFRPVFPHGVNGLTTL